MGAVSKVAASLQPGQPTLLLIGLPTSSPTLAQQLEAGASHPGLSSWLRLMSLTRFCRWGGSGATGWVSQDDWVTNLASVAIAAKRGEMALPTAIAARALGQGESGEDALIEPLSEREIEILRLLAQGLTNKDIAQTLCLSVLTVKTHLHHIFGKLGVCSRTAAALWATQHGYGRAE